MVLDDIVARIPGGEVRATVGGAPGSFHGMKRDPILLAELFNGSGVPKILSQNP